VLLDDLVADPHESATNLVVGHDLATGHALLLLAGLTGPAREGVLRG
jgi:hypothetical protein